MNAIVCEGLLKRTRFVLGLLAAASARVFVALVLTASGALFAQVEVKSAATSASTQSEEAIQTRVRELIYILRDHRVSERTDVWGTAIQELVAIGKPAVPELILELTTTQRNATMRGVLFTLRAIDDPRAIPFVVESLPKAQQLSTSGSGYGLHFANADLHRFMKRHENFPTKYDWVAYNVPINEIISTLHKLSRQPLPDLTKPGPHPTWNAGYWQKWGKTKNASTREQRESEAIQIPSREDDLVEQDGVRRFGSLFPTGPDQRLGSVVDLTLPSRTFADAASCLDIETGKLYENLEGLDYGPDEQRERLDIYRWELSRRIDLDSGSGDSKDLHLWQIDNARWDSLDSEVKSGERFDIGREAHDILIPFDKHPTDFKPDWIGTFLFTTREGSRGVMRVYPVDKKDYSRKIEYRLWNRDAVVPHKNTEQRLRDPGQWQSTKIAILKDPDFGKQCLFDFEAGKARLLSNSMFAPGSSPKIEELLKSGGILRNDKIAAWARDRGIDLATHRSTVISEATSGNDAKTDSPVTQAAELTILDGRAIRVTTEAFNSLTLDHAREIFARNPDPNDVAHLFIELKQDDSPPVYLFKTKSGTIGLLKILRVGERMSSIIFQYELAKNPKQDAADKR